MLKKAIVVHTDGGSRGNPGHAAAGFWIPVTKTGGYRYLGLKTNNEAEYEGVILALEFCLESGILDVHINSDSKLIVNQVSGHWRVNADHIQALLKKVRNLIGKLNTFDIAYVPREDNADADRQCNLCLDEVERELNSDPTGFFN